MPHWGVIRLVPRAGSQDQDAATFDGWYKTRAEAQHCFVDWCRLHPECNVALVKQFDWCQAKEAPL